MERKAKPIATRLLIPLRRHSPSGNGTGLALHETPCNRYRTLVLSAGMHLEPASAPTLGKLLDGHLRVTAARSPRHPLRGTIGLPVASMLYIRQKDIARRPKKLKSKCQTILVPGPQLVLWAWQIVVAASNRPCGLAIGAYVMRPWLR